MGVPISTIWTQYFPPEARLTGKNLPSQQGKVFLITGGNSGCGFELCRILYNAGGKVYMAARNGKAARVAIEEIISSSTHSGGELIFLYLDVADLFTVREAAQTFQSKERRLHVLWNNAGATVLPTGATSPQGHELTTATNCLGAFLLTHLLLPALSAAAKEARAANEVRVIFTSSILIETLAPRHGVDMSTINVPPSASSSAKAAHYAATKAGNYFLASEFARRYTQSTGILSLTQNPGNLRTKVWRNVDVLTTSFIWWTLYTQVHGAHTMLWAGLAQEVKPQDSGKYVIPWGRWHPGQRADIAAAVKAKNEGGSGVAAEFWDWCMVQCEAYS